MDNAQGKKIYYGIVLDNAQLRKDAEQSKNIFRGIGDSSEASAARIDNAFRGVSSTLMKLGAAMSAVEVAKGIYAFADRFERSMAEVTTISETVTNNLGKFKKEIIEMSTEIPVPADEAAKALYQIVSAGHDGAAGMEVLRVSAKAAVGGVTETVTAADAITSILNAYKKSAGEAESISDQLFTTVRLGKTTMGELGHSISQAIPIAASFGIESEQVLAAIATLTKSGTPTAQAVTQVRAAIKAASEQMGDGYFKTHTFQQGLQEIAEKAGGSEAKLRELVPEIEGMNGILGLTGINAQTAASDLDELTRSVGATELAFQKMANETSLQLVILKNNVLAEFSELGESMVDNVGKVAAALNEAFETGKIDKLLTVLSALIAMYGTYKATLIAISAIQRVALLAEQVTQYIKMARALGIATANQIAFNRASLMNPYTAIAGAIAAVVGGLVLFSSSTKDAEENMVGIARANKRASEEYENQADKVKSLADIIKDSNAAYESRKKALKDLQDIIPNYNAQLTTEGQIINDNTTAIKDYLTQLEKQIRLKAAQEELEEAYREKRKLEKQFQAEQKELSQAQSYNSLVARPAIQSKIGTSGMQAIAAGAGSGAMKDTSGIKHRMSETQKSIESVTKAITDLNSEITTTSIVTETTSQSTNDSTTTIKTYAGQVKETAATIKRLRGELADLRAGKGNAPDPAAAIIAKEKELKEAQSRYNTLLWGDANGNGKTVAKQTKYDDQIRQEAIQRQRAEKDLEFSVRQAKIDASAEGYEKILAQNELNHDREIEQIKRQKEDMLKAIQDNERTIWEAKNPDWEKKGLKFTPDTKELPKDLTEFFASMGKASDKKFANDNKLALDSMLTDFLTYEQQRNKIAAEYAKKREQLYDHDKEGKRTGLKSGVTQGNADELNRNENEALKAIDEQFAQREITYTAWCDQIANDAIDSLKKTLAQAKKELEKAEKSGVQGSKLAAARAKVTKAQEKVDKADADKKASPGKRTLKEWKDLYETLQDVQGEFDKIGDAVGGVAGEIIDTAGQIATSTLSMINGIVQLANWATISTKMTAEGVAASIQTVEKASVILTIISAAMQIAMTIINLFNNDEEYQKEIEKLQGRIEQLQWELDNADAIRLQNNTFNALQKVKEVYAETTREVLKLHAANNKYGNAMYQMFGRVIYQNEIMQKSAEKLATAYANISYTADKALGSEKFSGAKEQLQNIAQQQLLIQEQIKNEDAKKKTDHNQIADWERQIQELGEEANKIINEIVEGIIGGSAADLASELGDAFIEAFQNGEDAAEAWGDKVNDIVANVMKRMLVSKFLEEPLGEIFNKYKSKWYKDGEFAGIDAIMASMGGFANDLNAVGAEFQTIWANLPDSVKNMFAPIEDAREASEKGIATASQDSVDELNGRMTAVQGHTYLLAENSKILVANSNRVLDHLAGIEDNTKSLSRLEQIETGVKELKNSIDDIALKGIKIK